MIKTFKRFELKYLISEDQFDAIQSSVQKHLTLDPHCQDASHYYIHNIYFDTEDDQVIRKSLEKPYYKEKLRLRAYKVPEGDTDQVFLELKKKIGGVVAKRRATMDYAQAMSFVKTGKMPITHSYLDQQVLLEIQSFLSRYMLSKEVAIGYKRLAFWDPEKSDLRISFDEDIAAQKEMLIQKGQRIMEVKCTGAMPLWLTALLSDNQVYKISFSKYGTAYRRKNRLC